MMAIFMFSFMAREHSRSARAAATARLAELLARRGLKRRVARTPGTFLSAPFLVARSDYVVTMSARLAESLVPRLGLKDRSLRNPTARRAPVGTSSSQRPTAMRAGTRQRLVDRLQGESKD
jgi:hypothetical protein